MFLIKNLCYYRGKVYILLTLGSKFGNNKMQSLLLKCLLIVVLTSAMIISPAVVSRNYIAECNGGFANRLRVLSFYLFYASIEMKGAQLYFIWDVNEACPGHFLEIYKPLLNVTFIGSVEAKLLELEYGNRLHRFNNTRSNLDYLKSHYNLTTSSRAIQKVTYSQFVLLPRIQTVVAEYVQSQDVCSSYAMHIRRTDLYEELKLVNKHMTYDAIIRNINKHLESHRRIYVAADCYETQALFTKTFGDRVLFYQWISSNATNISHKSSEYRHTSLEVAVIDAYIASYAYRVKYSMYSSYSEWIMTLRDMRIDYKLFPVYCNISNSNNNNTIVKHNSHNDHNHRKQHLLRGN